MECKEVKSVLNIPRGDEWQYEVKLDGYRCITIKENNDVELYSRRGLLFQKFLNVYKLLLDQPVKSFILDGEIVALDANGRSDFNALQHAGSTKRKVHFYAFDLLHCDGDDLLDKPLTERQKRVQSEFQPNDYLHIPGALNADLAVVIEKIQEFGFEGIVAKRKDSHYLPGKAPGSWVKMKLKQTDEFIVGGYIPGPHGIDQLVVGRFDGKDFKYVDALDDGFVPATRREVHAAIKRFERPHVPFTNLPEKKGSHRMDREKMQKVTWVKPKVVVEIAMNEWTSGGHLRHAEFRRIRDDKTVKQVAAYPKKKGD